MVLTVIRITIIKREKYIDTLGYKKLNFNCKKKSNKTQIKF